MGKSRKELLLGQTIKVEPFQICRKCYYANNQLHESHKKNLKIHNSMSLQFSNERTRLKKLGLELNELKLTRSIRQKNNEV